MGIGGGAEPMQFIQPAWASFPCVVQRYRVACVIHNRAWPHREVVEVPVEHVVEVPVERIVPVCQTQLVEVPPGAPLHSAVSGRQEWWPQVLACSQSYPFVFALK